MKQINYHVIYSMCPTVYFTECLDFVRKFFVDEYCYCSRKSGYVCMCILITHFESVLIIRVQNASSAYKAHRYFVIIAAKLPPIAMTVPAIATPYLFLQSIIQMKLLQP